MTVNIETDIEKFQSRINALKIEAENFHESNPAHAVISARKACEAICRHICLKEKLIEPDSGVTLFNMINLIADQSESPRTILDDIRFIQKKGNTVVHSIDKLNPEDAAPVLNALSNLVNWCFQGTTSVEEPQPTPAINPEPDIDHPLDPVRNTFKKPWFQTLAIGVMSATATVLATKKMTDKKSDEQD